VPHPDGDAARCGSPLAKAYQAAVDAGTLTSAYAAAKEAIDMNAMCSYWISARERVKGQFVVWQDNATGSAEGGEPAHRDTLDGGLTHRDTSDGAPAHRDSAHTDTSDRDTSDSDPAHTDIAAPAHLNHGHPAFQFLAPEDPFTRRPLDLGLPPGTGVILPQVVPMGTVTRRGVEPTWMTAANAKRSRLGSELKAMVRCPRGFRFVGADVDSEELWIAALLGDAQFSTHGATAFGWMTLQGSKAAATDLHSNTARILGIDRGRAKVFNYARIYGAGVAHATTLLRQFNPGMAEQAARARAERLYAATKGRRCHARAALGPAFWHGGSESFMFNRLEREAARDDPRTPALGCAITDALQRRAAGDAFMTSRVNWVVQSSGVDYLHLLLVAVRYLARRHHVDMRFVLSVHDEVRYMVRDQDAHRAAMCLQVANLWVRALFSSRVGIRDLPHAVAFFSAVDVDHVLRKEVDMDCVTPTNPHAVPAGQSYSIADTLRHTAGGRLDPAGPVDPAAFVLSDNHLPLNLRGLEPARPAAAAATAPPADEPDSVWLTAQMLSSSAEISALLAARDKRSAPPPPPPSSRPGGTSTRRIVAR
ncbi:DNA-directed DNA polymerase gamma mip1, partial [Coemansia sp. RSA 2706]